MLAVSLRAWTELVTSVTPLSPGSRRSARMCSATRRARTHLKALRDIITRTDPGITRTNMEVARIDMEVIGRVIPTDGEVVDPVLAGRADR